MDDDSVFIRLIIHASTSELLTLNSRAEEFQLGYLESDVLDALNPFGEHYGVGVRQLPDGIADDGGEWWQVAWVLDGPTDRDWYVAAVRRDQLTAAGSSGEIDQLYADARNELKDAPPPPEEWGDPETELGLDA